MTGRGILETRALRAAAGCYVDPVEVRAIPPYSARRRTECDIGPRISLMS
jgi:hypothetical protein